jgi:hypothetical protein
MKVDDTENPDFFSSLAEKLVFVQNIFCSGRRQTNAALQYPADSFRH